jgi:hypothetical protein
MPVVDNIHFLPFSIKVREDSSFLDVLTKAIKKLSKKNKSLLKIGFDVSTMSADIMLKPEEIHLDFLEIKAKYGTNFTLRRGMMFKMGIKEK